MYFLGGLRSFLFVLSLFAVASTERTSAQEAPARVRIFQENISCPEQSFPCRTNRKIALVFVHGLTGSRTTWLNPTTSKYWPEMISQDRDLADYDVFRVDFDSFAVRSSPSISQINSEFFAHMRKLEDAGYEHIAFIGHSLGGLIVQRYLKGVLDDGGHLALNRYRIVIFLGTPQKGSNFANYVTFMSANPTLRILGSFDTNDFGQFLQEGMQAMTSKHDQQQCSSLRFFAASEGKDTSGIRVVNRESAEALSHACQEFPLNHIEISKPSDESSDLYKNVKAVLAACARQGTGVCPPPRQTAACLAPERRAIRNDLARCEFRDWSTLYRR